MMQGWIATVILWFSTQGLWAQRPAFLACREQAVECLNVVYLQMSYVRLKKDLDG